MFQVKVTFFFQFIKLIPEVEGRMGVVPGCWNADMFTSSCNVRVSLVSGLQGRRECSAAIYKMFQGTGRGGGASREQEE